MKKVVVSLIFIGTLFADTTFVDWSNMNLKVTSLMGGNVQLDRSNLSEKFLQLLKNTPYDANQKVSDVLRYDFQKEAQLVPYLQDYRRVDERYLTDGSQEIDYEMPLLGKVLNLVIPASEPVKLVVPMCCPTCKQEWPQNKPVSEGVQLVPKEENIPTNYTSVVIDCRNVPVEPALFPKIKNDRGEDIFSVNFAQPDYITENGLVQYINSTQDTYNNNRVGYNPLRINAIGISGRYKTDPVITQFDAVKLHGSKNMLELLSKCRVIFLIGQ